MAVRSLFLLPINFSAAVFVAVLFGSVPTSGEAIREYETVNPVLISKPGVSTEGYPKAIKLLIPSSLESFHLTLRLNEDFIFGGFTSVIISDGTTTRDESSYPNCYYTGEVEGHSGWTAVMSICQGIHLYFGDQSSPGSKYYLSPLSKMDHSLDQPHAFYNGSQYSSRGGQLCGNPLYREELSRVYNSPGRSTASRSRRQSDSDVYYVEWVIVNDNVQYTAFNSNMTEVMQRSLSVANGVNNLYLRNLNIRVVLTMVITLTTGGQFGTPMNSSVLLDRFTNYAASESGLRSVPRDNIMLLSGSSFNDGVLGVAFTGTMCDPTLSIGVTLDGSIPPLDELVATATHEIGHNFNMRHDDGNNCECLPDTGCIMAADSTTEVPTRFSNCSRAELSLITNQLTCLLNVPSTSIGGPRCGNGVVEGSEVCDCGEPGVCTSSCCNPGTCQLNSGAQCTSGGCCNTSTCQLMQRGAVCRASRRECDLEETCSGESSGCPTDSVRANGSPCDSDRGYCFNGTCPTHRAQCLAAWNTSEGVAECYSSNTDGVDGGNCGHNVSRYLPCSQSNVLCGLLHCNGGTYSGVYMRDGFTGTFTVDENECSSFDIGLSPDTNPGLVEAGTKCGDSMVCINQECRPLSVVSCPLGSNNLMCSGPMQGVCTNSGTCSCLSEYSGDSCGTVVGAAPITTESSSDHGSRPLSGAMLIFLSTTGIVLMLVF